MTDLALLALLLLAGRRETPHVVCCCLGSCRRGLRFGLCNRFGLGFWHRLRLSDFALLAFLLLACGGETAPFILHRISSWWICRSISSSGGSFLLFLLLFLLFFFFEFFPGEGLA